MFLIDHNEAGLFQRGKHRRTCADDNPCFPAADAPPLVKALPGTQAGVQNRGYRPKACAEPVDHLRREGDFRHKDHGAAACGQRFPHQADEHFRFTAACYTMEQEAPLTLPQPGQHLAQHFLLLGGQHRVGRGLIRYIAAGAAQHFLLKQPHQSLTGQVFQRGLRIAHKQAKLCYRVRLSIVEQRKQCAPFLRSSLIFTGLRQRCGRNRQLRYLLHARLHPVAAHFRGQHQPQGFCQRTMGVVRHVLRQRQQRRQDGRVILQGSDHIPQLVFRHITRVRKANHYAFLAAGAERHFHPLTDGERHALRYAVGEGVRHLGIYNIHNHLNQHTVTPVIEKINNCYYIV